MGQVADDIAEGLMCSWCGTCFRKAHGYPVICDYCWEHSTAKERKGSGVARATEDEI